MVHHSDRALGLCPRCSGFARYLDWIANSTARTSVGKKKKKLLDLSETVDRIVHGLDRHVC